MRHARRAFLLVVGITTACFSASTVWFPQAPLIRPLISDPRELHFSTQLVIPVGKTVLGEVSLGDYVGISRWDFGSFQLQASVGGGIFSRFDVASTTNDMESVDFYANIPFDFRSGDWAFRFMLYHTSAHLGDDYLKQTGGVTEKHSWDNVRWLVTYEGISSLRLYSGYQYAVRTLPTDLSRHMLQAGFEWQGEVIRNNFQPFWANDFQSWGRAGWNPSLHSKAGIRVRRSSDRDQGVSFFIDYGAGLRSQGQFFQDKESRWTFGVDYHFQ